ncbi:MAG: hypothetical protein AAF204_05410, partial [Pseudomonadota bacterium]
WFRNQSCGYMSSLSPELQKLVKYRQMLGNKLLPIIDIGGNSVRLEIRSALDPFSKTEFHYKFKVNAALASEISQTGSMGETSMKAALKAVKKMMKTINDLKEQGYDVSNITAIGTAPFRDAENGEAFADAIRELGVPLEIISGEKEAEYSAMGVLAHMMQHSDTPVSGLVADMGGGSADFALIENNEVVRTHSLPLGTLRIKSAENPEEFVHSQIQKLPKEFQGVRPLFFVGGTPRNIAKSFAKTHGINIKAGGSDCEVSSGQLSNYVSDLASAQESSKDKSGKVSSLLHIKEERLELIRPAAILLDALKESFGIESIALSKATMRDGIRASMMNQLMGSALSASPSHDAKSKPAIRAA